MSKKVKLTEAMCKNAICPDGGNRITVVDSKMPGLILRVGESGAKAFYAYRWFRGQPIKVKLGDWPAITLDQARELANQVNMKIASGVDPRAEKLAVKAEMTLGELFQTYLEMHARVHKRSWKLDVGRYNATLKHWANRKLSSIRHTDVATLHARLGGGKRTVTVAAVKGDDGAEITPAYKRKIGGPYSANRTVELLSSMYSFAKRAGYKGDNPADGIQAFPEQQRERFLTASELPRFFSAMDDLVDEARTQVEVAKVQKMRGGLKAAERVLAEWESFKDFVLLCLLTGARKANVAGMAWLNVDFDRSAWSIPSSKSKSGDPMTIVLTDEALDILRRRKQQVGGQWVFPSNSSTSGHYEDPRACWDKLLERAGLEDVHLHDLRRSMGSWLAAGNTSLTVIGRALGHRAGSGATAIYARLELDPVRQAMEKATAAMLQFRKKA